MQLLLDAVDDLQRVHTLTHDDDSADGLSLAVPFRHTFADVGSEAHSSQIAHQDRCPILTADCNGCEIIKGAEITEAADHVLRAAQVKNPTANFICAHLYFVDDCRKRYAIGKQLVGIELHLILPDEAADAGDLSNPRNGLQGIAQVPVLQATQIGKTMFAALIDDGILIDPTSPRRIGADGRMYVLRQTSADLLQVFDDARTRPIEVRTVLENYIDVGITQHGLRAHSFNMRGSQQTGDDGIGHLIFDDIGWLACPLSMNDHLHIGDIRQC